jgi:hypothetical protein
MEGVYGCSVTDFSDINLGLARKPVDMDILQGGCWDLFVHG